MPKQQLQETVLQDWVCGLTFQMQALLLTAMRGPDENNKYNAAKAIIRYLRGVVIKPAGIWRTDFNDGDFMWGCYKKHVANGSDKNGADEKRYSNQFEQYAHEFWQDHDEYPHHFIMHLVHCAEVVGYKHPDESISSHWKKFYLDACDAFHMNPETCTQMTNRLDDFGQGVHSEK